MGRRQDLLLESSGNGRRCFFGFLRCFEATVQSCIGSGARLTCSGFDLCGRRKVSCVHGRTTLGEEAGIIKTFRS